MKRLCRDCGNLSEDLPGAGHSRCGTCRSPRTLSHPELERLSIAHVDCDAFYATIEKRDDPAIAGAPVIVGGRHRGVVTTACYIARRYGVRSAMPMFQALRLCPHAVVIPPNMDKYRFVAGQVRVIMQEATPRVEPVSIDEAFLDFGSIEDRSGPPAAALLARMVRRIEEEVGVTASIGLSCNKFLAKIASDLDKPRGFATIGEAEAREFLAPKPVSLIPGVGPAMQRRLDGDGIRTIGQLQRIPEPVLVARYGRFGRRLAGLAVGRDPHPVETISATKSISAETTLDRDLSGVPELRRELHALCARVAARLEGRGLAARTVVLKLKTTNFRTVTRSRKLESPTRQVGTLFQNASWLLDREAGSASYRLIGVGASEITDAGAADPPDLFSSIVGPRPSGEV